MIDIDKALDDADFATDDVPICLKGSLVKDWERAEQAVIEVQDAYDAALKLNEPIAQLGADRQAAIDAFQVVEQRMKDASITFRLTGVDEATWKAVLIKHPPRADYQLDQFFGYNIATAPAHLVRACLLEPVVNDVQWERLTKRLTDAQFQRLVDKAISLNRDSDGTVPFSSAVFEAIRSSGETSRSPETSASAPADSGDGRPAPKAAKKKSSGTDSPAT